ncbi:MAG TPA: alkaline phosphatase family protein [Stellaceae bacterium]|nr:alkaline phosphatase family protein [Stellaceae bacterium]
MDRKKRAVIVVCDSLRPDLVASDTAPALAALAERGTAFAGMRAVFPSVTRVSAASLATGCRPAHHGLCGNTVALDEGEGLLCLSVGPPGFRERLRRATGRTLLRPTLAELLAGHGGAVIYSNVSPGAAYFHDPDGHGRVHHRAGSFGPGLVPQEPLPIALGAAGDAAMTERFCRDVLEREGPALAVLWLSEPDHTGHATPLGSPEHRAAIRAADRCVSRVLETVRGLDPRGEDVLFLICSDHGMETTARLIDAEARLVAAGLKESPDSSDVVVAPNGTAALFYVADAAQGRVPALVRFLENEDWVGACHHGEGLAQLGLPGATALKVAVALRVDDSANPYGVEGCGDVVASRIEPKDCRGLGQHGGTGRHESRAFLAALGGGFAPGRSRHEPALVDLAPTVLHHLGLPAPAMDGKALQMLPPTPAPL